MIQIKPAQRPAFFIAPDKGEWQVIFMSEVVGRFKTGYEAAWKGRDLVAMFLYNKIMSVYEVQQAYQAAASSPLKGIRMQNKLLGLFGYTGELPEGVNARPTKKERNFIELALKYASMF